MKAGDLRHTISMQTQTDITDGMGGFTTSWANVSGMGSVRAAIWPLKSNESLDAMKIEHVITHKIRIRYRSGVTTKHRILFGSRTFNVISILNPDERNIMLEMLCEEQV